MKDKNAHELLIKKKRIIYWEKFGVLPSTSELRSF